MEFGPEIKVDGIRPEWFTQSDAMNARLKVFRCKERAVSPNADPVAKWGWDGVEYIRLPANHPHYTTPTPDERAVAPELVAQMAAFINDIAERRCVASEAAQISARAILAALEPVDEDLVEAEKVVAQYEWETRTGMTSRLNKIALGVALAALARGRQLEKEGK